MKKTLLGIVLGCLVSNAWAYTASDYSQDGLLHQWDAIANVNAYTHDANATVWKDLAGGLDVNGPIDLLLTENGSWGENWFEAAGLSATGRIASVAFTTIEVVYRMESMPTEARAKSMLFSSGKSSCVCLFWNKEELKDPSLLCQGNGSWQRYITVKDDRLDHIADMQPQPTFYYDKATTSSAGYVGGGEGNWSIGVSPFVTLGAAKSDGTMPWQGRIYAIRLYNRALSADEVAAHMKIDRARFFGEYPANSIGVTANDERFGNPTPGYGALTGLTVGESYDFTAEQFSTNVAGTAAAECDGWEVYHKGEATPFRTSEDGGESKFACTISYTGDESIKWIWKDACFRVKATGLNATPDADEKWAPAGGSVTFTATPASGCELCCWDGDVLSTDAEVTIPAVDDAMSIRACAMKVDFPDAERIVRVSSAGSDASDGSSWANAYKTPTAAVAALAGETRLTYVVVGPGRYDLTSAMALSAPIRVVGAGSADTVFDGGEGAYRAFSISHADAGAYDLTIQRYFPQKVNGGGVSISNGELRRCLIKSCHCKGNTASSWDTGHGGGVSVSGGIVGECTFVGNTTDAGNQKGNAFWLSGSGVVTNCDVYANDGGYAHETIDYGAAVVYVTGGQLVASKIHDNNKASVGGIWAKGGTIVNCLVYGNSSTRGGAGIRNDGATVVNCTIYGNVQANDATGESGLCQSKGTAINNIVWGNGPSGQLSCKVTGGTFSTNVIDAALGAYPDNYVSDPKFVDAAAGDFHISSRSSDAFAQGDPSVAPATDFDGTARKAATPDIGAYEYDMSREAYGVSLKLAENYALGTTVTAEAVVTRADPAECSLAWSVDGAAVPGTEAVLPISGLSAGYHTVSVAVDHPAYGAAAATNTIAVKPYAVFVNTTGSGTFPYDTAEKGTNALTVAYQALWRDTTHTSVVTIAEGLYSLKDQILVDAPVWIEGAGRERTLLSKDFSSGRCFILNDGAAVVSGLSVTDGTSGGAFSISRGLIEDCCVSGFKLPGGVNVDGIGANVSGGIVRNCLFDSLGGAAGQSYGGGMRLDAGLVSNCVIRSCNTATGLYDNYGGGGIWMAGGTLVDCRIEKCGLANGAQAGAAIKVVGDGAVVERCVFSGNVCTTASTEFNSRNAIAALQCTNSGKTGARRPVFRNCLFCNNVGYRMIRAGEFWSHSSYHGAVDLVNVTVASNATALASIYEEGTIRNSILDSTASGWEINPQVVVSNSCCAALTDGVDGNITGDPCFKRPASGNFRLRAVSPCLNTGDPSPFADEPEATDLDGNPRVYRDKIHMGCYQNLNLGLMLMVR